MESDWLRPKSLNKCYNSTVFGIVFCSKGHWHLLVKLQKVWNYIPPASGASERSELA